jgi:hypothetical protein
MSFDSKITDQLPTDYHLYEVDDGGQPGYVIRAFGSIHTYPFDTAQEAVDWATSYANRKTA